MSTPNNTYTLEEVKTLLSTLDGCSIDCKVNGKPLFESDNLVLFSKEDALYIEHSDRESKESESTRLVILYQNIINLSCDHDHLNIITINNTEFNFKLNCRK